MKTKQHLLISLIFVFSQTAIASNFYWVGGTGNWSDYAAHWATSSGGTVFHVTIPTPSDDVFFDANSFPAANDTLYMDTTITNCRNMDWTGVSNQPAFKGIGINLQIYGSLILSSNMIWKANGSISMNSSQPGNIINTSGLALSGNGTLHMGFTNPGSWQLASSLTLSGNLVLTKGTLHTNNFPISCLGFTSYSTADSLLLGSSAITCDDWILQSVTVHDLFLDAVNASFNCSSFHGGTGFVYPDITAAVIYDTDSCTFRDVFNFTGLVGSAANSFRNVSCTSNSFSYNYGQQNTFNKLTIPCAIVNFASISDNLTADTLIFNGPNQQISIAGNFNLNVNSLLSANGTCDLLTSIHGNAGTANIIMPAGTTTLNYVLLKDIAAFGGATFIANNSVDAGNVTGFTINASAPRTLFWVAGTGNWNDQNHWALSSGGAGGNCVPNQFDDVFFDANSFTTGDSLYVSGNLYCNTMDWTAVTNSPVLYGVGASFHVFGSLLLSNNIIWKTNGSVELKSTLSGNVLNTAGLSLSGGGTFHLNFNETGSWNLMSPLSLSGNLYLTKGTLHTNNFPISCLGFTSYSTADSLLLGSSAITCDDWILQSVTVHDLFLDAVNASFNCSSFHGGTGFVYPDITASVIYDTDSCTFRDVFNCTGLVSAVANSFRNVSCTSNSFSYNYGQQNTFNKLTIPCAIVNFASISDNLTADTLIFNGPNQQISIAGNFNLNVNSLLSANGTCDLLTSIHGNAGTANIIMPAGITTLNYVLLKDIAAFGGATFIANNSVDAGNVTGFTINAPAPRSLFWVGGTGNWNDQNHWALSSGGAGGNCVPNQSDDVFFDANSFTTGDSLYTSGILYCNTMDWTAVTNSPTLFGIGTTFNIFGSLLLSSNMIWKANGSISMNSSQPGNIINTSGLALSGNGTLHMGFTNPGSWQLANSLTLSGNLVLTKGTLHTNNFPISCLGFTSYSTADSLLLGSSAITCDDWILQSVTVHDLFLDAVNASFNCNSFHGGTGFVYPDITASVIYDTDSCTFRDVFNCTGLVSAVANSFRNVSCTSNSFSYNYGLQNTFNKLTIPCPVVTFSQNSGNLTCDSLIFNGPGQQITLSSGFNLNVNDFLMIQSDPGFPTSIQCTNGTANIIKPSDTVCTDYVYLQNIIAMGGAVYFAGDHSVDLGGNSGWNWIRCAPLISNVWPGDCNYDLVTDNFDLLNIGVAFGDTGYVRPGASFTYAAQPCQDWYYQFINAANVKHADCDGNGTVDFNDTNAISLNYGLTHPARLSKQDESNSIGAELSFVLPPVVAPGTSVSIPVTLGTNLDPANNLYGIAFTVNYDPAYVEPGTMSVAYSGSWIEITGNHLHIEKDFPGGGQTDIAFTRIDHNDVSGFGLIATLTFTTSLTADGPLTLSFSHVRAISHNEIEIPIQTTSATTWVGIHENEGDLAAAVFPNPVTETAQLIFSNPKNDLLSFMLMDAMGRVVRVETISGNSFVIRRNGLSDGIYLFQLRTPDGRFGIGKIIFE